MLISTTPKSAGRAPAVAPRSWREPATHFERALSDPWYAGVVRLQDTVSALTTDFWRARGARTLHLPVTTGSISSPMGLGSDSLPVSVEIAGTRTYLADSMQFMLEYGVRLSPAGAYYVMPSFRGESSDATHLSQFFHSEAEFPGGFEDMVSVVEAYVRYLIAGVLEHETEAILNVTPDTKHLETALAMPEFRRITFEEAVELVGDTPEMVEHRTVEGGLCRSLTRAAERRIMHELGEFSWVTHMDHLSVPFYQAYGDSEHRTSLSGDLLFGIGEVVGGGERHRTANEVSAALERHGVAREPYAWYLRMRELQPIQTSGFGMGVERFLMWLLRHDDIRDFALLIRNNGEDILP